ncbi:MAG: hypothetical protein AAGN15_12580 [Cyanobacteria bacterium J06581_3]
MTYTSDSLLDTTAQATDEPTTAQKLNTLKQEGTERTKRIASILRQAFSETREEFQAGRTVISPIAKDVTTEAVSTVKQKSQQAAEAVSQAWNDEAAAPDLTERIGNLIKVLAKSAKDNLFPTVETQAKKQAIKIDQLLGDRYGEQYTTLKDRFATIRDWLSSQASSTDSEAVQAKPTDTDPTVVTVDSTAVH